MKAWQLHEFGLNNLRVGDVPIPSPGPHQLLVKVKAASLNYRDKAIADGVYLPEIMPKGMIPVSDAAGEVVAIGAGVKAFTPGDRVISHLYQTWQHGLVQPHDASLHALGGPLPGALAEYMLLDEQGALKTPPSLSDEQAATLPIAALTAWFALVEHGRLKKGQTVVVQGTGGVSLFAIQFATALGARVIVLSGSDDKLAFASQHGAKETINYRQTPDWSHKILELTSGLGADNVLDVVGGSSVNQSVNAVKTGGQVSIIGFLQSASAGIELLPVIFKAVQLRGILVGNRDAFENMNALIGQQDIRPVIDSVYEFKDLLQAYKRLSEGPLGKIVIRF